jgi:hypothetical protein
LLEEASGDALFIPLPHDPAILPDRHETAAASDWLQRRGLEIAAAELGRGRQKALSYYCRSACGRKFLSAVSCTFMKGPRVCRLIRD